MKHILVCKWDIKEALGISLSCSGYHVCFSVDNRFEGMQMILIIIFVVLDNGIVIICSNYGSFF